MWNQLDLTQRCLRSLGELTRLPDQVIIVDNGSSPNPRTALETTWPDVTLVQLERNRGFAGGCNAGIRQALREGADAVLLLNNDTVADPALVAELLRALEADPGIAAAGAKTLTDETPARIHAAYGVLTFHGSLVRVEGWLEPRIDAFGAERDVDSVFGTAMLLRRSALEAVGLLDEEFFAYHEDIDWCTRARRRGWRIRYVPSAIVYHRMHASTGGGYTSPISYLAARNSVLFVRKNATLSEMLAFVFYTGGHLVKDAVFRWRRGELDGYRLRLRGLRDGLLCRAVPLAELGFDRREMER
jgi:GT2 family glycosyltransferase